MHHTNEEKCIFFITKNHDQATSHHQIADCLPIAQWNSMHHGLNGKNDEKNNLLSSPYPIKIVTDAFHYQHADQVLPIQPEQLFFMDYTSPEDIAQASVLDIGVGSGVLSIFCLLNGATSCVGLDVNPRAKILAGHNAIINHIDKNFDIRDGSISNIFESVKDKQFDFICSNPPFEPTPPGIEYYLNSAAGVYGMDFAEKILSNIDQHLSSDGTLQMVTMAPGDAQKPFKLYEILENHLTGLAVEITLDRQPILYDDFVNRFSTIFGYSDDVISQMKRTARNDGVTHLHMLILKYKKGRRGSITEKTACKTYENWTTPLGARDHCYM
ncbi:methyltransferase [Mycetohabitans sp. B8]|uniref:methyltransferase n=1 Tax=Mycetohabitans sp. B8 TaxID=2841845 RepID=UPI001F019586|nr:methyltransferase [Mycetohabitans sp. B8]MCG1042705.1 methyltransferase [Mycetohabitans sp. B8]